MIKYTFYDEEHDIDYLMSKNIFEKFESSYIPINGIIHSKWDIIKSIYEQNKTINSIFYYYLYNSSIDYTIRYFICSNRMAYYSNSNPNKYFNLSNINFQTSY